MRHACKTLVATLVAATLLGPASPQAQTGDEPAAWSPIKDEHVVEEGDTLWDLCEKVVGDPFQWPKVWSFNAHITNPHWIYPGDRIRFFPSEVPLPVARDIDAQRVADSRALHEEEATTEVVPEAEAAVTGPAGEEISTRAERTAPAEQTLLLSTFVTPKELQEAGVLTNAVPDKFLLGPGDTIYVSFPGGKLPMPGDRFMIYRTLREVEHPETGDHWGYMTQMTGTAVIVALERGLGRARVVEAIREIERGQRLTPLKSNHRVSLTVVAAQKEMEGFVLAVHGDEGRMAGEHEVVFVDKGTRDGLEVGNQLLAFAKGDPLTGDGEEALEAKTGTLLVVDAHDTAATCLVMQSLREIRAGDAVRTIVRRRLHNQPSQAAMQTGGTR